MARVAAPQMTDELEGLRALARSLAGADADDVVQEAAIAAIERPPPGDGPLRPWLFTVLRNRWRMDRRGARRRAAREASAVAEARSEADERSGPDAMLDRARMLERLAAALVALDEPFREAVMLRYLDGGRAPADGGGARVAGGAPAVVLPRAGDGGGGGGAAGAAEADPLPGQGRAVVEPAADLPGGGFRGRVVNWSTGDGVANAELTFAGATGDAITVRSGASGGFELLPARAGTYTLATIEAAGFLPYAPEWQHSTVRLTSRGGERVRGLTVFLFPAIDYRGLVVDRDRRPVAGARVRLLGTPGGEQALAGPPTAWVTDRDGRFVFHATDDAVLEAEAGGLRGRARLDGDVAITHEMTIVLGEDAGASLTIAGRVVGADGIGVAGALVRAAPAGEASGGPSAGATGPAGGPGGLGGPGGPPGTNVRDPDTRAVVFATSGPDGGFELRDVDDQAYEVVASADGAAPAAARVAGGARDVELILAAGEVLRGKVVGSGGAPIPAFTLLVFERRGLARALVESRVVVDGGGAFAVHVRPGEYVLMASAAGWAPSAYTPARAGEPVTLTLPGGATLRGTVVTAGKDTPVTWARVSLESGHGGASAAPANPGTVTRDDGTFELTGIPPGPLSLTIGAGGHHPRIEAGLVATDGAALGPITIPLTPLAEGEAPQLELVGIGVQLKPDGDGLRVERVIPGGGAEAAGIVAGDLVVGVDGQAVTALGFDGAIARVRGAPGTRVRITLERAGAPVELDVERRRIRG